MWRPALPKRVPNGQRRWEMAKEVKEVKGAKGARKEVKDIPRDIHHIRPTACRIGQNLQEIGGQW